MTSVEVLRSELELHSEIKDKQIEELQKTLEFACGWIDDHKKSYNELKSQYIQVINEVADLRHELAWVRYWAAEDHERLVYVDDYGRRNSLRFRGIPEDTRENWEQTQAKIVRLLQEKLGIKPEIERAHRLGDKSDDGPREIIVKFLKYPDKEFILKNRDSISGESVRIRVTFRRYFLFKM